MQNHAHNVQVEFSEPFPSGNLFPRLRQPSGRKAVRLFELPGRAVRSSSQASERIALQHDWLFRPGDPIDARELLFASGRRLQPIVGDFLSPLEDDAAPVTRRDGKADEKFGSDISWVQPEFVDAEWAAVSLSDAAAAQANGGRIGWYRRSFDSPAADEGRHIDLEVIGGFGRYTVWLNGRCVGRPGGGSTGLRRDLTPHILAGGTNTLVIRVEDGTVSSEEAGLARYVSLVKKDSLHLGQAGSAVTGVLRSGGRAELTISAILHNEHGDARRGTLCCTLLDPSGRALAETEGEFHVFGQDRNLRQLRLAVNDASRLAENPGKYLVRTRIAHNDEILDEEISLFDLRAALSDDLNDEFLSRMC